MLNLKHILAAALLSGFFGVSARAALTTDNMPALALQNTSSNQAAYWYMDIANVLGGAYVTPTPPAGWTIAGSADFNADTHPDLLLQNATTNQVAVWYMNNTGLLTGAYLSSTPAAGWRVAGVGDFNGDGKPDIILQNASTNQAAIWYLNNMSVTGGAYLSTNLPAGWSIAGVGDFNGDGKPDIVLQSAATNQVAIWYLNNAAFVSGAYASGTPQPGWKVVAVGDYNSDNKPDLILQNTSANQAAIWFMNNATVSGGAYTSIAPGAGWVIRAAIQVPPLNTSGQLSGGSAALYRADAIGGLGTAPIDPATRAPVTIPGYVPVVIHITAGIGSIPSNSFSEYHVYRSAYTINLSPYVTAPSNYGAIPARTMQTHGPLTVFDDGSGFGQLYASKPNPQLTTSVINAIGNDNQTPVGLTADAIGQRFQYSIEGLWSDGSGNYHLTSLLQTPFVTYLQPASLNLVAFSGTGPTNVTVQVPQTFGADDYVLNLSTDPFFAHKMTYTPAAPVSRDFAGKTLLQEQADPRNGPLFTFFSGHSLAADFPNATQLFARVGVRDSRNGTDLATNPYLYCDPVQVPSSLL